MLAEIIVTLAIFSFNIIDVKAQNEKRLEAAAKLSKPAYLKYSDSAKKAEKLKEKFEKDRQIVLGEKGVIQSLLLDFRANVTDFEQAAKSLGVDVNVEKYKGEIRRLDSWGTDEVWMMEGLYAGALAVLIVAQTGVIAYLFWWLRGEMEDSLEELDTKLAMAIQKVIGELPLGDFEAPNAFQQFLMQLIQQKTTAGSVEIIPRDPKGQFIGKE